MKRFMNLFAALRDKNGVSPPPLGGGLRPHLLQLFLQTCKLRRIACLICLLLIALPVFAATGGGALADPAAEARAMAIGDRLRCVVCQSESINDSQASMASDLRLLVREKIQAGWSDQQIIDYARSRYGDFILLSPPLQANTSLLWLSPLLFAVLAVLAGAAFFRRRQPPQGEI